LLNSRDKRGLLIHGTLALLPPADGLNQTQKDPIQFLVRPACHRNVPVEGPVLDLFHGFAGRYLR